jgi:DNA-binding NtrC family response regulator
MVKTWKTSKEKEQLKNDILSGVVSHEMKAAEVYNMHEGIYHRFEYVNFQNNLRNLRNAIHRSKIAAHEDEIAFRTTLQRWRQEPETEEYPPSHESEAKELLLEDIASGELEGLKPAQVHQLRPEYQEYPLTVFRDHLIKETKKPTVKAYWEHQKDLTTEKKEIKKWK